MNWPLAIARNREALLAIVAAVVALAGGRDANGPIARRLRNAALALLRPAEAAARRLIVIAARGLVVTLRPSDGSQSAPAVASGSGRPSSGQGRTPAFALFDRRKRYVLKLPRVAPRGIPRIRTFWPAPAQPQLVAIASPPPAKPVGPAASPDPESLVNSARLRLRIAALEWALADLPRQARRLARWRARAAAAGRGEGPPARSLLRSPLRLGRPPGWRAKPIREVDRVLRECHALALDALAPGPS